MKRFFKTIYIIPLALIFVLLCLAVNVFALDDLTIVESSMHALGSSSKFTKTKLSSGSLYGYKLSSTDYIYKWAPIDISATTSYNFQDKTHGKSGADINEYSYLVYRTNFVSENIESFYLATASSKQVSTLVTSDNWTHNRWNNLTFVCCIDKSNTDLTKVALSDIKCYINGREVYIGYTSNPFTETDSQVEFRLMFNVDTTAVNAALYMGWHNIYATVAEPLVSMPAFDESVNYDSSVNMVWFPNTTRVKEILVPDGYLVNVYQHGDFETLRTPSQVIESYDLITIKGTDYSLSYYNVIIGDIECQIYDDKGSLFSCEASELIGGYKGKQEDDLSTVCNNGDDAQITALLSTDIIPLGYNYYYFDMLFAPDSQNYSIAIGDLSLNSGLKYGKWNSLRFIYDLENKTVLTYINGLNIDTVKFNELPNEISASFNGRAAFDEVYSYYSTDMPNTQVIPSLKGGKISGEIVCVNNNTSEGLIGLNGLLNVYTDDTFSTKIADDEFAKAGNMVVLQSKDNVYSYYTVSETYVFCEGMESGWSYSDEIIKIDNPDNIVLNDAQKGFEILKQTEGYIQFDSLPDEMWDYFIMEFDALQTDKVGISFATDKGEVLMNEKITIPQAEWCKITYVLNLTDKTYKVYIDGVIAHESNTLVSDFSDCKLRLQLSNLSKENLRFYIDNMKLYFSNTAPLISKVEKPYGIILENGLSDNDTSLFFGRNIYTINAMTSEELKEKYGITNVIDVSTLAEAEQTDTLSSAYLIFKNDEGIKTYKYECVKNENIIILDDNEINVYAHSNELSSFIATYVLDKHIKEVKIVPAGKNKFSKIEASKTEDGAFVRCMLWNKHSLTPLTEFLEFEGILE